MYIIFVYMLLKLEVLKSKHLKLEGEFIFFSKEKEERDCEKIMFFCFKMKKKKGVRRRRGMPNNYLLLTKSPPFFYPIIPFNKL